MHGEQKTWWYFVHAYKNLNLRILRMLEGIFSLDAVNILSLVLCILQEINKCFNNWKSRV